MLQQKLPFARAEEHQPAPAKRNAASEPDIARPVLCAFAEMLPGLVFGPELLDFVFDHEGRTVEVAPFVDGEGRRYSPVVLA